MFRMNSMLLAVLAAILAGGAVLFAYGLHRSLRERGAGRGAYGTVTLIGALIMVVGAVFYLV